MKKSIITFGLALLLVNLSSCYRDVICIRGHGGIFTEERVLDKFDALEVDIPATVHILQDPSIDSPEITIEAQENILDNIRSAVRGNRLIVKFDQCVMFHRKIEIYLTVRELNEVQLNGSGEIIAENVLKANSFKADLNGSGNFDLAVEALKMEVKVDGSGQFRLEGSTSEMEIMINGSGDVHAYDLEAKSVWVNVNGSGNTEVNVTDYLQVEINGSGDVRYMGNPNTNISINGSGRVARY